MEDSDQIGEFCPIPKRISIDRKALNVIKGSAVEHFHRDPGGEDMIHRCLFLALSDYLEQQGVVVPYVVAI